MRYMGGKTRIAKHLAKAIHDAVPGANQFWDAFCGGLSMSVALSTYGDVVASDTNPALIALYRAVRRGWSAPYSITRARYEISKLLPDSSPLKAFCGFGCSYGGKWFGGYAHDRGGVRNYAAESWRAAQAALAPAEVECLNFLQVRPQPVPWVIYCDPPYAGTTEYDAARGFDTAQLVRRVREWSAYTDVFVSEYAFPIGEIVWEGASTTTLAKSHIKATERMYWIRRGSL